MSINLTIMRAEPITQQEFESLVQNDPELDFTSLADKQNAGYKKFSLRLGDGCITIPCHGNMLDGDIAKFIALADQLGGRLQDECSGEFYRTPDKTFEDEEYLNACQHEVPVAEKTSLHFSPDWGFWFGIIVLLLVFVSILFFMEYWKRYCYYSIVALIAFFLWKQWKSRRGNQQIQRNQYACEKEISAARSVFRQQLGEIAGTGNVLLILPNGIRKCDNPDLKLVDETLKNNTVIEKSFAKGESIITPKSIAKIDTEIRKSHACRTIVFFYTFSQNIQHELECLELFRVSSKKTPKVVILEHTLHPGDSMIPFDLSEEFCAKKIALSLCLSEKVISGQGAEWIPQAVKIQSCGLPEAAPKAEEAKQ